MSIRGFKILWLKMQLGSDKHIHFSIPVPFYIFRELLDCLLDLLAFVSLFVPRQLKSNGYNIPINSVRELVISLDKIFVALTEEEPYELVGVSLEKVNVSIIIR